MSEAEKRLASFIDKYNLDIGSLVRTIRARMRELFPTALELVYDNYNALAIGYSPTEKTSQAIFSIALYPRWVSLFFLQAAGLPDPHKRLKGSGNVAKHVVLPSAEALDDPAVRELMKEAVTRAKVAFPAQGEHRLIVKAVSEKQRPRRPAAPQKAAAGKSIAGSRKKASARG